MNLTCKLRNRRRRERAKEIPVKKRKRALRNRAVSTLEPEAAVLDQVLAGAGRGGIVVIPSLNPAFEKARGRTICRVHALSGAGSPWLAQTGPRYGASAGRCLATRSL